MSGTKEILVEKSSEKAAAKAAEIFRSVVCDSVYHRGVCNAALSGGTTPRSTYQLLADQALTDDVPWSQVEVFFGDERDVPQDDVESNFRMVQRTLLDHTPIDWARVHPMRADAEDIGGAANEYEETIRHKVHSNNHGIPQFDLVMLGMGGDGHTASLFPGCANLDEMHKLVVACFIPVLGRHRISFTFPLINAARNVLLLVTGDDKADAVRRVIHDQDMALPSSRITPHHGTLHIVLDSAAARLL